MTDSLNLDDLRAKLKAATPVPCERRPRSVRKGGRVWYEHDGMANEDEDLDLIVAAVNALPQLLAIAEAAQAYVQHKWPTGRPNETAVTLSVPLIKLQDDLADAVAAACGEVTP